jgi:hypothetical protein
MPRMDDHLRRKPSGCSDLGELASFLSTVELHLRRRLYAASRIRWRSCGFRAGSFAAKRSATGAGKVKRQNASRPLSLKIRGLGDFMHKSSLRNTLHAGRRLLTLGVLGVLTALAWSGATASAQSVDKKIDLATRPEFREPIVLTSKDGVLEVRLTARQGQAVLDTVATPVQNFLLFDYEVIRGTASNGQKSGGNLYPAPTLQVFPGERLIVHFENSLSGLTIRDYFIPQYTPKDQPVPLYPEQMTSSPINLHTHGAHISPKGNADNVMLHIPSGMSNTYTYDIPRNMPQGLYWYHCHLHGLTAAQVYTGLVGLLAVGRTDGNLPLVTEKRIPVRNMALQYNFVFDRAGGLAQLNNLSWPQWAR